MSLLFWQRVSKPSLQETLHLALGILVTAISVWTHPHPLLPAPLCHLREVEEHLTAPDLELLFPKIQATPVAGECSEFTVFLCEVFKSKTLTFVQYVVCEIKESLVL